MNFFRFAYKKARAHATYNNDYDFVGCIFSALVVKHTAVSSRAFLTYNTRLQCDHNILRASHSLSSLRQSFRLFNKFVCQSQLILNVQLILPSFLKSEMMFTNYLEFVYKIITKLIRCLQNIQKKSKWSLEYMYTYTHNKLANF